MAGRGVYPGQDHHGTAPNSLPGPSHNDWNDRSYRHDGHPSRPPANARPSVMDRLGPFNNRRPAREADPAPVEAMPAVEVLFADNLVSNPGKSTDIFMCLQPIGSRKRLSSAVVVDGQTKQLSQVHSANILPV